MKPTTTSFCICMIFETLILINLAYCSQVKSSESLINSLKDNYQKLSSEFDLLIKYSQNITANGLNSQKVHPPISTAEDQVKTLDQYSVNATQSLTIESQLNEIKILSDQANASIVNIQNFHKTFISQFEEIEDVLKKKNLRKVKSKYEKNVLIYNSVSLVMLCMLSGGLVGVIFILYYSFSAKDIKSEMI